MKELDSVLESGLNPLCRPHSH